MKRIITFCVAAALVLQGALVLSACGSEESKEETGTVAVSQAADTTAAATQTGSTAATAATGSTKASATTAATTVPTTQKTTQATTKAQSSASGQTSRSASAQPVETKPAATKPAATKPAETKPAPTKPAVTEAPKPQGSFGAADTDFVYNGQRVSLNENMSSVLSKLGKAVNVSSAPSCHGDGEDKTYEYNGFTIYTYPGGGNDLVLEVNVLSSAVPTSKGIKVGSSLNDITAVYGNGYTTDGNYIIFSSGIKTLQFFMNGNTVSEIDYYYNV